MGVLCERRRERGPWTRENSICAVRSAPKPFAALQSRRTCPASAETGTLAFPTDSDKVLSRFAFVAFWMNSVTFGIGNPSATHEIDMFAVQLTRCLLFDRYSLKSVSLPSISALNSGDRVGTKTSNWICNFIFKKICNTLLEKFIFNCCTIFELMIRENSVKTYLEF